MSEEAKQVKRKQISKRVRFEVFKRDGFKCQYCGSSAPEVILHVDHIHPVSKEGDCDMMNLITSCCDCNLGKSNILLSDASLLKKQRAQLDEMNERREQLEMMLKWRDAIKDISTAELDEFCIRFKNESCGWGLNDSGKNQASDAIKKFGLKNVLDGLEEATKKVSRSDGKLEQADADLLFQWTKKFANYFSRPEQDRKLFYIRGIVRNRHYCNEIACLKFLKTAVAAGVDLEELAEIAKSSKNWSDWQFMMDDAIQSSISYGGGNV
jgi:hypothetical protein